MRAPRDRLSDACLAFCGKCRHLEPSLSGRHACSRGHDLGEPSDFMRCADRSPFPESGGDEADMSE